MIVRTWRPKLKESGDTIGGCDRLCLEWHLEVVDGQCAGR